MISARSDLPKNTNIFSNHVPVLYKIGEKKLNILTLNLGNLDQSDSKLDSRVRTKIVDDLSTIISKQKLDMILLQNAACIATELKNKFTRKWCVLHHEDNNKQGLFTLFNNQAFLKLEMLVEHNNNADPILKDRTLTVKFKNEGQTIIVHNVCWPHQENGLPLVAEKHLLLLLACPIVVAGTFGSRVASSTKEKWVNNIGCFVVNKEKHIQQLEGQLIDLSRGNVIQVTSSIIEDATDERLKKQSFFVNITAEHKKAFADEKAVGILEENGITPRETTNAFNERGLALIFDPKKEKAAELHTFFEKIFNQDKDKKDDKDSSLLCCPKDMLGGIAEAIKQRKENLLLLDHARREIKEYKTLLEKELSELKDKSEDKKSKTDKLDLLADLNVVVEKWIREGEADVDRPFYDFRNKHMEKNKATFEEDEGFILWKKKHTMKKLFETILIPLDANLLRISIVLKVQDLNVELDDNVEPEKAGCN